jgi:tRNA pseudouridine38-40 synthase
VAVRAVAEVAPGFDPRRHAVSRTYRYRIRHGVPRAPLTREREWRRAGVLDVEAMARAAALLPREPRDWAAFAGKVPERYTTVRTLRCCEVRRAGEHRVVVTMEADGFLPHQVRRTVGALVRVGSGGLAAEEFAGLVDGAPSSAGPTAPPQGLVLCSVVYPPGTVNWGTTPTPGRDGAPAEEGRE